MNNKTTRYLKAFTLLELIVAIALMDVIAVALYSSMYTAFKAKSKSQAAIRPFQSVNMAFENIRRDLVSTVNPDGIMAGVFVGENNSGQGDLETDTLSFYTSAYQPGENISSNIVNVAYELENDPDREPMVLKRLITKNILSPITLDPQKEIICSGIKGLSIEYYDGASWLDEWDSSEKDSQLPWAVRMTLTIYDEQNNRSTEDGFRDFTRIFMLLSANQQQKTETQSSGGTR